MGALYAQLGKAINQTELAFVSRVFNERDFYDTNPLAKMVPGWPERESAAGEIIRKAMDAQPVRFVAVA